MANVQLTWDAPVIDNVNAPFDPANIQSWLIKRDGANLITLGDGTARSHTDVNVPAGPHVYETIPSSAQGQSDVTPDQANVTAPSGIPGKATNVVAVVV